MWHCQHSSQKGETLVGVLISIALGIGLLSGASVWWAAHWRAQRGTLQSNHSQQDLRFAMESMVHDIRRAQFFPVNSLTSLSLTCMGAFCGNLEDFDLSTNQILFSLDRNENSLKDNNECTGFRLSGNALQIKTACTPAVWTAMTDVRSVQISGLEFSLSCVEINKQIQATVSVSVRSQVPGQTSTSVVQRQVRIRNALQTNSLSLLSLSPSCKAPSA